jgi:hypothetical protein
MEVSDHPQAPAALSISGSIRYTLNMRVGGPRASLHVLEKRKVSCTCRDLSIVIMQPAAQSLHCNTSSALKFLYAFLTSLKRVTSHAYRILLGLIILNKKNRHIGQVVKLLIMQFAPSSFQFLPLITKYCTQHLSLKTLKLYMYIL